MARTLKTAAKKTPAKSAQRGGAAAAAEKRAAAEAASSSDDESDDGARGAGARSSGKRAAVEVTPAGDARSVRGRREAGQNGRTSEVLQEALEDAAEKIDDTLMTSSARLYTFNEKLEGYFRDARIKDAEIKRLNGLLGAQENLHAKRLDEVYAQMAKELEELSLANKRHMHGATHEYEASLRRIIELEGTERSSAQEAQEALRKCESLTKLSAKLTRDVEGLSQDNAKLKLSNEGMKNDVNRAHNEAKLARKEADSLRAEAKQLREECRKAQHEVGEALHRCAELEAPMTSLQYENSALKEQISLLENDLKQHTAEAVKLRKELSTSQAVQKIADALPQIPKKEVEGLRGQIATLEKALQSQDKVSKATIASLRRQLEEYTKKHDAFVEDERQREAEIVEAIQSQLAAEYREREEALLEQVQNIEKELKAEVANVMTDLKSRLHEREEEILAEAARREKMLVEKYETEAEHMTHIKDNAVANELQMRKTLQEAEDGLADMDVKYENELTSRKRAEYNLKQVQREYSSLIKEVDRYGRILNSEEKRSIKDGGLSAFSPTGGRSHTPGPSAKKGIVDSMMSFVRS